MYSNNSSRSSVRSQQGNNIFARFTVQGTVLALILAMIVLVPLVSGTDYLKNYGKPLVFEVLGCVLFAVLASQISYGKESLSSLKSRLRTGPTIPVIALVVYATLLYFLKPPPKDFELTARAELFRLFFCGLVYVAVGLYVRGVKRLQIIIDVLLAVGAVVAIISLGSVGYSHGNITIHGTFGTHETLGSFLLLVLPLALPIAIIDLGDQKRQIAAQVVSLLIAAALLMAHTRAAWFGSSIALFVLAVLYRIFQAKKLSAMSGAEKAAGVIGPLFIMLAAIALFFLTSQQGSSIATRASTIANLSADKSAHVRYQMAEGAIHMIKLKPLFGWGVGTYPLLAQGFTGIGRTQDQVLKLGATLDNNAHSFYLQFAAEEGLVGMAIFSCIPILFLVSTVTTLPGMVTGMRKCVTIGCIAASIGQLVDAGISPSYNLPAISMFQFLVFGVGILAARGLDLPSAAAEQPDRPQNRVRRRVSSSSDDRMRTRSRSA